MAERVYPASKPSAQAPKIAAPEVISSKPSATKQPPYGFARPNYYRPQQQPPPRRRRSCCCTFCLWITILIVILLILTALSGAVFWVLYRPQRPRFSVDALRISQFNVTSSSKFDFKSDLAIKARNSNKKLRFDYDPFTVYVISKGVPIGKGYAPGFVQTTKNVTVLRSKILSNGEGGDDVFARSLRSDLKERRGLPLTVTMETKVGVKFGGMETKKVRIKIVCGGIRVKSPVGKSVTTAAIVYGEKCDVDLRIKIWRWTF